MLAAKHRSRLVRLLAIAAAVACCSERDKPDNAAPAPTTSPAAAAPGGKAPADPAEPAPPADPADKARGKLLVARLQCNRCHEGARIGRATTANHCVRCHREIRDGTHDAEPELIADWRKAIVHLLRVPGLDAVARLRRPWVRDFLLAPHDLRPGLDATMPPLQLSETDARDIAAYLGAKRDIDDEPGATPGIQGADPEHGRKLYASRGCATCHAFSGAGAPGPDAAAIRADRSLAGDARALAPDLRFTRHRMRSAAVAAWIRDPRAIEPHTPMPPTGLSAEEARDIAAFLVTAELKATTPAPIPARPAPLPRRVGFTEVFAKVFGDSCWHCHAPGIVGAAGGEGYSGGFGYAPRAISLVDHEGVLSGHIGADGERASLVAPGPDGMSLLERSLWARHSEVAGKPVPGVRGMPLGLPPLPPEQIRLVATWVAGGAPP